MYGLSPSPRVRSIIEYAPLMKACSWESASSELSVIYRTRGRTTRSIVLPSSVGAASCLSAAAPVKLSDD